MINWDDVEYYEWSIVGAEQPYNRHHGTRRRETNDSNDTPTGAGVVRRLIGTGLVPNSVQELSLFEDGAENGMSRSIYQNPADESALVSF